MTVGRRSFAFAVTAFVFTSRVHAESANDGREKLSGAALDTLLADIKRARQGMRTLVASFTQERKIALLATTVKSTGKMAFLAPDRLRWELEPPDDVVYVVGPEGLSYRTRSSRATMPAGSAKVARGLRDLRALLTGDIADLAKSYTLTASRSADDVALEGIAKEKSDDIRSFTLTIDKALVLPLRARLIEGKADSIDIVFSHALANTPVDAASMRP